MKILLCLIVAASLLSLSACSATNRGIVGIIRGEIAKSQKRDEIQKECKETALRLMRDDAWLESCANGSGQEIEDARIVESNCTEWASAQKREDEWLKKCLAGDRPTILDGLETKFMTMPKTELCVTVLVKYGEKEGTYAQGIADKRKIKCSPLISDLGLKHYNTVGMEGLCLSWYYRKAHPSWIAAADKVVSERKTDCVQVINGLKQEHAIREQTSAMESAAIFDQIQKSQMMRQQRDLATEQMQLQRDLLRREILIPPTTETRCQRHGDTIDCTTR